MPRKSDKSALRKDHKKSFLKRQKQLLETKLTECLKQQKRTLSSLTAIEKGGADLADIASAILDQWVSLKLANCCAKELRDVCRAIDNMKSGTYEICENCERLITENRLTAVPWATRCTKCQEVEEQRG